MKILSIIDSFHHGDTVRALNILCWVLAGGYVNGRDNVTGMCVEATKSSSHSRTSKVLKHIELHQGRYIGLEDLPHHITLYYTLTNHRLATPFNPVNRSRLLVRTEISCKLTKLKQFNNGTNRSKPKATNFTKPI